MRIISKFKDYYDYLTGIWGIDEKAVLDRTSFTGTPFRFEEGQLITFFVCDLQIQGYYAQGRWRYGEELYEYERKGSFAPWKHLSNDGSRRVSLYGVKDMFRKDRPIVSCNVDIVKWNEHMSPNSKKNVPILQVSGGNFLPNPILKDYNMASSLPPETIYLLLNDWLLREVTIPDNMTNKEKILAHGFDYKTSFRNVK